MFCRIRNQDDELINTKDLEDYALDDLKVERKEVTKKGKGKTGDELREVWEKTSRTTRGLLDY